MTDDDESRPRRTLPAGRVEAFSDGVFAIAITLLVLEISVPEGSDEDLLGAVLDQWPSYLAYVISFATVGAIWLAHSVVTEYLRHVDRWFVRINLLLLLLVSFLPFPTRLLAESVDSSEAASVATTVYGLTLLATGLVLSALWRHAVRTRLVREETADTELEFLTTKLTPGLAGYLGMIVLGLFLPLVAVFGYLLIAIFYLVPFGLLRGRT